MHANRVLFVSISLAVLAACNPASQTGEGDTGNFL
jgi:hypothetical protein